MDITYRRTKLDREQKERIARDYNNGMAIAGITAKYRIGRSTLYKVLRDVTVAPAPRAGRAGGRGMGMRQAQGGRQALDETTTGT